MPWKESSVMDERMRFVIRLKDGESMASLCREFGIFRKTGYKIFERYEECGLEGLSDRTRRPFRYANQLPEQVEATITARRQSARLEHHSRRALSARPGAPDDALADACRRHAVVRWSASQRSMVDRLQGRVPARRQTILLPAHGDGPRLALSAAV